MFSNSEYGYLSDVTSSIQSQLNGKQATISTSTDLAVKSLNINNVADINNLGDASFNDINCVDISATNFFSVGSSFFGDVHATGASSFNDISATDISCVDISMTNLFLRSNTLYVEQSGNCESNHISNRRGHFG